MAKATEPQCCGAGVVLSCLLVLAEDDGVKDIHGVQVSQPMSPRRRAMPDHGGGGWLCEGHGSWKLR